MNEIQPGHSPYRKEIEKIVIEVFTDAFKRKPFDALCSLLRVEGMSDANWDPFEESLSCFEDFNWFLKSIGALKKAAEIGNTLGPPRLRPWLETNRQDPSGTIP